MSKIEELRSALIIVTRVGLSLRVIICFLKIVVGAEEDLPANKNHIKSALIWLAISECAIQLQFILTGVYSGG